MFSFSFGCDFVHTWAWYFPFRVAFEGRVRDADFPLRLQPGSSVPFLSARPTHGLIPSQRPHVLTPPLSTGRSGAQTPSLPHTPPPCVFPHHGATRHARDGAAAPRAGPLRSPPCPRPSARRGPPMPPLRELWDSVPGPGRLPQSPARPRALSLLRGDADRGGQAAHGPWGTPLRPAPPAPPAGAPYPSGLTCVGSGLWMLDSALSAAGLVPEDAVFCWHGGDNVYLRD